MVAVFAVVARSRKTSIRTWRPMVAMVAVVVSSRKTSIRIRRSVVAVHGCEE